jgi:ABC-type uncharacterized transport system substrate-binding protein
MFAKELVGLQPDVIVVNSAEATKVVQQQTQTIPIIFILAGDPVANGIVGSISRPEGNTTGFSIEAPIGGRLWVNQRHRATQPAWKKLADSSASMPYSSRINSSA